MNMEWLVVGKSNFTIHSIIFYLTVQNLNGNKIYRKIVKTFGENVITEQKVYLLITPRIMHGQLFGATIWSETLFPSEEAGTLKWHTEVRGRIAGLCDWHSTTHTASIPNYGSWISERCRSRQFHRWCLGSGSAVISLYTFQQKHYCGTALYIGSWSYLKGFIQAGDGTSTQSTMCKEAKTTFQWKSEAQKNNTYISLRGMWYMEGSKWL